MLVVPGRNATHVEPAVSSMKPSSMQWTPVRRCSFAVVRYGVDAEAGDFAIAHFELLLHAGQVTQFRSADGSEVFRMREKHPTGIANELVEADAALSDFASKSYAVSLIRNVAAGATHPEIFAALISPLRSVTP